MLDIHSHILPKMDDGSKSVEMSLQMLRSSYEQGVTTIVSTSHFYGNHESPDEFLHRRDHAAKKIESELTDSMPQIFYGAEVLYYPGISRSEAVCDLAIEGTDLILIELPFVPWTNKIFEELQSFQYSFRKQIVLAHVERYRSIQSRSMFETIFEYPFYYQCNAEAFNSFKTRRLALQMMEERQLHFLGTDCHRDTVRCPNMNDAKKAIEKKFSPRGWEALTREMEDRFNKHKI